jgi:hypothetical protein
MSLNTNPENGHPALRQFFGVRQFAQSQSQPQNNSIQNQHPSRTRPYHRHPGSGGKFNKTQDGKVDYTQNTLSLSLFQESSL